jgi:putative ABC transport system permease protein
MKQVRRKRLFTKFFCIEANSSLVAHRTSLPLRLIRLIGIIVPQRLRLDWRQEWESELRYREALLAEWDRLDWRSRLDLLRRSLWAFRDALLLQPRRLEDEMFQDLRYGARMLLKHKGFTAVAVLTLALGIGANTAIFTVINSVLLRPLPLSQPERLMLIRETKVPQFSSFAVASGNFLDWIRQNTTFERLVAIHPGSLNLTSAGNPVRLRSMNVTDGFFAMLGVQPQLGRGFTSEEHQPGRNTAAVLSHGLWQQQFGANPAILNQTIQLDGRSYTVVGIMSSTFQFWDRDTELWIPIAFTPQQAQQRLGHSLSRVIGQLKPGITPEQGRAELIAIADRLALQYPESNKGWSVMLVPLQEFMVRDIKPALMVLIVAVSFVLLIACANVANLLLARATGRYKEIAIRTALGAGRERIIRQLLTESALLAAAGGAGGLLLAKFGLDMLLALVPQGLPRMDEVSLDGRVLVFSAAVTLLTGIVFGLVPALQASKPNLNDAMKVSGRGATEGGKRQLMRSTLVVMEIASTLLLLLGAGLMIKSFWRIQSVDPGFIPENALTASISLPRQKYIDDAQRASFFHQLLEKVNALPGVQAVGITSLLPLSDDDYVISFDRQDRPPLPAGEDPSTNFFAVNPDYFKAMGIRLLRGRLFTNTDTKDSLPVTVINETMAKKIYADEDAIGKRFTFDDRAKNPKWFEIVGIVNDVKHYGLDKATSLQTYVPFEQLTFSRMTIVTRTTGNPTALSAAIRNAVLSIDKELPLSNIRPLDVYVSTSIAQRRFSMILLGVFAAVALALSAVGIYGVLSYAVTQRTNEIGVRMALGAQTADIMRMIVGHGMRLVSIGVGIGLVAAFGLTRLLQTLLFGVSVTDPPTYLVIVVFLVLLALLACWIPARRATRVDPLTALRLE